MIREFRDEYFFLSNFYNAPVTWEGITYRNNEAAFQAAKCIDVRDRAKFSQLDASSAKRLGRQIPLRSDWEKIKFIVMQEICFAKFTQNPHLRAKLIATGSQYLEEGNTWGDRIWGTVDGQGQNMLGKILMGVRAKLSV